MSQQSFFANRIDYRLEDQVGFALRVAQQRHTTLFAEMMIEALTPTQWAALAKLAECGAQSQNQLGRLTAMDAATIKGVIDRLTARGFTLTRPDPADSRRLLVDLTQRGGENYARAAPIAREITAKTLAPLDESERALLIQLLRRIA
jgi:DNA-binding MarR family transcriptional regulator